VQNITNSGPRVNECKPVIQKGEMLATMIANRALDCPVPSQRSQIAEKGR